MKFGDPIDATLYKLKKQAVLYLSGNAPLPKEILDKAEESIDACSTVGFMAGVDAGGRAAIAAVLEELGSSPEGLELSTLIVARVRARLAETRR